MGREGNVWSPREWKLTASPYTTSLYSAHPRSKGEDLWAGLTKFRSKVSPRETLSSHVQRSQQDGRFLSGKKGQPAQFPLGCLYYAVLSSLHHRCPTPILGRHAYSQCGMNNTGLGFLPKRKSGHLFFFFLLFLSTWPLVLWDLPPTWLM